MGEFLTQAGIMELVLIVREKWTEDGGQRTKKLKSSSPFQGGVDAKGGRGGCE